MNKTKSLSLLLVLCMILGMVPFSFAVSADETAAEYYVMYGGKGDGTSPESPMGDTKTAIAAIEADDGVTEGTLYIMNNPELAGDYLPIGEKYHKYLTWTTPAAHTKPIHVIGYDENSETVIMSTADTTAGDIILAGPVRFSNLTLARMRNTDEGFTTGGYDVTFDKDVLFKQNGCGYGEAIKTNTLSDTLFRFVKFGSGRGNDAADGGRVTWNSEADISLTTDWKGGSYTEDVTLAADASGNAFSMEMVRGDSNVTYGKNLNFVFGNVSSIAITRAKTDQMTDFSGLATVKGDFQTIHPNGTTVTLPNNVTVNGDIYDLTVSTDLIGALDVTETSGTYTVTSGTVYAYNDHDVVYYNVSGNDTITVPAGSWKITSDRETAIANFKNAVDDGNGTITDKRPDTVYVSALSGDDTNNGITAETPFKTLKAAVNAIGIHHDGTVVILDGKNYEVYSRDGKNDAPYNYGPDNATDGESIQKVVLYTVNNTAERIPNHTGTITYVGAEENTDAAICFGANHLELRGPTVFKNLTLIEGYNSGKQVVTFGYPLEFDNVAFLKCGTSNKEDANTRKANATLSGGGKLGIDVSGRNNVSAEGTLVIGEKSPNVGRIGIGGWDSTVTIAADQKLVVEKGASIEQIKLLNNNGAWTMKNINVVLNEKVGKLYNRTSDTSGTATVNAVQIVENNGVDVSYDRSMGKGSATVKEGVWFIKADEEIYLDTTDKVGTFTSDKTVYAYQPNGSTILYGTTLNLTAGDWFVAASAQAAQEANGEPTPPTELKTFDKWVDNGDGTITASFGTKSVDGVYYVMFEGTGDGTTAESPMGDIAKAIAAIETDATVTEGTVYVRNNPAYETYLPAGELYHKYLTWTTPKTHTKLIHVIGFDDNSESVIMSTTWSTAGDIILAGSVHFSNITLARMRSVDEGIMTGGYDVTFDKDVFFKQVGLEYQKPISTGAGLSRTMTKFMKFGSGRDASSGKGGRVTLNTDVDISLSNDWKGGSYAEDVTLVADASGKAFSMVMVNSDTNVTYAKNLNFIFGNVSGVTLTRGQGWDGSKNYDLRGIATVEGDFQTIHPIGTTVTLPGNVVVNGKTYDLAVSSDLIGSLDVTETGGTFRVIGDDILVATDVNNAEVRYLSNDDVLTVPEGAYTVSKLDDASKVVTLTFDTDYATIKSIKGSSVTLPAHEDKLLQKFLGWKRSGDDTIYPAGTVYNIAEDADTTLAFTSVWDVFEGTTVVFVDAANGSDDNDGLSAETAFKTIAKGFAALETKSEGTKKLAVIGYCAYSGDLPANSTPITITGDGSGSSVFDLNNDYINAHGDIILENIALGHSTSGGGKYFATNGYALTIGDGITSYNGKYMAIRLGKYNGDMTQKLVTMKSGSYGDIDLGPFYNENKTRHTLTDSDIVIDGASVDSIRMYADYYLGSHFGTDYAGHVRFTVNSGSLGSIVFGTLDWNPEGSDFEKRNSEFADGATFQLLNNNGTKTAVSYRPENGKNVSGLPESCENIWIVTAGKADGCFLEYTENDGVYKVVGDKSAIAYQNGKAVAVSSRGHITIPKGITEVKFVDKFEYLYVNDTITFYEDVTDFDVAAIEPDMKEGMIFCGWYNGNTAVEKIGNYSVGDTLTAQYMPIDTTDNTGEFYILGAQIRKGSENVEQGLRFIIERKGSVADKIGAFGGEYLDSGSLVLPTDLTRGHDMKYGQPLYNEYGKALPDGAYVTTWSNGTWSSDEGPSDVPATNIFKELSDGGEQYTVCITGIDATRYDRFYSVKGYVRYNDANGVERVLYTEYYQTSLATIAKAAIAAGETDDAITSVVDYYENDRWAKYKAENYDNRTDLRTAKVGSTTQSWQDTEGSAAIEEIENTDFYELNNGLRVREVVYTLWGDNRKSIDIIQVGDTHLNYVNDKDWMEQSNCILATYKGRVSNRNGSSVLTINRFMEYASFFDQTVITGDIMDYFSWGCAEMVQKLIVDKDPNVLFAIGNHEPAIHMQSVDHICNTEDSLEAVHERLSTFWPNSTKYASRILKNDEGKDMVMLVVMDNEAHQYLWEEIYEGLKADIEKAREKNLKILIFEHCPISTRGGEAEDYYSWFYKEGDTSGFDAAKNKTEIDLGKREAGSTNSELDKRVYNLIVNNADVVRGVFCGDYHNFMYTEIKGSSGVDNTEMMIPQYISTANMYDNGCAVKITIK